MTARIHDGWLTVPYDGPDTAVVRIGVAEPGAEPAWSPAFLDYVDGQRVAKIRPPVAAPHDRARLWLMIGDSKTMVGPHPS